MRKHLLTCSVHVAAAALCLGTAIVATSAGSFTRGCAARDLQVLGLIEERESTDARSAEILSGAMLTILNARMICYEGHVVDALAIYDDVAKNLAPHNLRQSTTPNLVTSRVR
jgi:hypothetical protein